MESSETILSNLRRIMDGYAGKVFTEDMRQQIRVVATDLMYAANNEAQASFMPFVCANRGTSFCSQTEEMISQSDFDPEVCWECHMNGGFTF